MDPQVLDPLGHIPFCDLERVLITSSTCLVVSIRAMSSLIIATPPFSTIAVANYAINGVD